MERRRTSTAITITTGAMAHMRKSRTGPMLSSSDGECMIQSKSSCWGAIAATTQAMLVQAPHGLPEAAPACGSTIMRVWVIADPPEFGLGYCNVKCRPMAEAGQLLAHA